MFKNIRFVILGALFCIGTAARAVPIQWTITDATFGDGAAITGDFTYDADTASYSNWNISVAAGTDRGVSWTPFNYNNANSSISPVAFLEFRDDVNSPSRKIRFIFPSPLTNSGGAVPIATGGASAENYCNSFGICSDERIISSVNARVVGLPPNTPPTAIPTIGGNFQVGSSVTGSYSYSDAESDAENPNGTTYKFVTSINPTIVNSSDGTIVASGITGGAAGSISYTLQSSDQNYFIYYCVVPAALTGSSPGAEVCSTSGGPITKLPTPPVINDSTYTTFVNTAIGGSAGAGGQVPTGSEYQSVKEPTSGQFTIGAATGEFTYTPNTGFTGADSAIVRVCLPAPNNTVCDDALLTFNVKIDGNISTATPVPTLGEWALLALTSLVALFGAYLIRRRQS